MTGAELVVSVLVCTLAPGGGIDRSDCVHVCEVVASVGECKDRVTEIRLTLPANMTLASFPECYRPAKRCGAK
jgi:hypothetical protein